MADDNVIQFKGETLLDLDPDQVLEKTKGHLKGFVLVGYNKDGELWLASTYGHPSRSLVLIERGKTKLMDIIEKENI